MKLVLEFIDIDTRKPSDKEVLCDLMVLTPKTWDIISWDGTFLAPDVTHWAVIDLNNLE